VVDSKNDKLNRLIKNTRKSRELREQGYRSQALKLFPHVCGRCGREFNSKNLHELTVHHKDHNHDNNPVDGSNWELLCIYCHDNEHQRLQSSGGSKPGIKQSPTTTYKPFTDLKSMLKDKKK